MTNICHPQDALKLLWTEFPRATMTGERDYDYSRFCGYSFQVGRSKLFVATEANGGVDYDRVKLFLDGQVYARDKRALNRSAKRARATLQPLERNPWLKAR